MNKSLKEIIESKLFDALIGIILFLILALGIDYAMDEIFTGQSVMFDLIFSLLIGILMLFRPAGKKLNPELTRKQNEKVELIGKMFIGFLLFVTLIALMVVK
ncbi:MAG: hypothetical protein PHI73_03130 [Patescibacteria group bacterium]|nr:hypothetical protein [Patescibacteria group bacterium]